MTFKRSALVIAAVLAVNAGLGTAAVYAADKECKLEIAASDLMQFSKKELSVAKDCTTVEVVLTHTGKLNATAMGHNWVLVATPDITAVATDGMKAGAKGDFVKPDDVRVIAHTKLIGGGQTAAVKFPTSKLKAGQSYTYICTFPGHSAVMKGAFKVA